MRGSLFGLRSGANSVVSSPVQTPAVAPQQPLTPHTKSQAQSRPDSGVYISDVEPLSLPPSVAPSDTARPSSRPLGRLGLAGFRKASPAPRPREASTNGTAPPLASPGLPATTSVSYLDGLSLRLGEAVSKALLLPAPSPSSSGMGMGIAKAAVTHVHGSDDVLKGKKPLPGGRGRALGALISGELQSASQDSFLYRAVLRLLQRPLSVLLTNLTTQVTNLILTPEFAYMSSLAPLNATQTHALAFAHFASELLETFDAVGLGRRNQAQTAPDGLRSEKEALENVVSRVTGPFLTTIKHEIANATSEFRKDASNLTQLEKTLLRAGPILTKSTFAGEAQQSAFVQSLLAQAEISTIWNCLTALSDRSLPRMGSDVSAATNDSLRKSFSAAELRARSISDATALKAANGDPPSPTAEYISQLPPYVTPPDTPQVAPVRDGTTPPLEKQQMKEKDKRLSFGGTVGKPLSRTQTPPTPPASKKLSLPKLPSLRPLTVSRAPSPPNALQSAMQEKAPPLPLTLSTSSSSSSFGSVADVLLPALKLLLRDTLVISIAIAKLPLPHEGGLARDAVDEASKEMDGFVAFLEYLTSSSDTLQSRLSDTSSLLTKSRATPMLLAMPILLRLAISLSPPSAMYTSDTVAGWIGLSGNEYRETCLSGFGKADECAPIVGKAFGRSRLLGGALGMGWMREWAERSTQLEEDSESDSEAEG